MTHQRLCLECMEVTTENGAPLCLACDLEHDIRRRVTGSSMVKNHEEGAWWGLTMDDIDPEDLSSGFYVTSVTGGDSELSLMEDGSEYY